MLSSFQSKLVVCIVAYHRRFLQYNFMDLGAMPPTWALLYLLQYRFGEKNSSEQLVRHPQLELQCIHNCHVF